MAQIGEIFTLKAALRKEIRSRLKQLENSDRERQSQIVSEKIIAHPKYESSEGVSVFLSMRDEIDTQYILKDIFGKGKKCFIPRYSEGGTHMTMVQLKCLGDLANLPTTKWNIPQPQEIDDWEDCLKIGGLDLVLTPGLGFTKNGQRLGRGKGYYDSFFRQYRNQFNMPYTIGLALKQSIVKEIPVTSDDVKLDEVIYVNNSVNDI